MTQLGSLDEAVSYIKKLKEKVDELHHRRSSAKAMAAARGASGASTPTTTPTTSGGAGSPKREKYWEASAPVVEVRQRDDTSLDVVLVCSTERPIILHEVITILEEEGAEVVNANHSIAGHKIFYTIHSQVAHMNPSIHLDHKFLVYVPILIEGVYVFF
ncbi:hypothetical protein VPH35_057063 [Triticum aestivum]